MSKHPLWGWREGSGGVGVGAGGRRAGRGEGERGEMGRGEFTARKSGMDNCILDQSVETEFSGV